MEFYMQMLPILLVVVALILSTIYSKSPFFTIPIIMAIIPIFFETSFSIEVILLFFWILHILSHFRVSGIVSIKEDNVKVTKVMLAIDIVFLITIIFLMEKYYNFKLEFTYSSILSLLATGLVCFSLVNIFLYYMIAPIFVKRVEYKEEFLENYFRIEVRHRSGNYIKFKEDDDIYKLDSNTFKKFKGRVGVSYRYVKYTCIFNVKVIDKIEFNQNEMGEKSNWEKSVEESKKPIKNLVIVMGLIIILVWSMVLIAWIKTHKA